MDLKIVKPLPTRPATSRKNWNQSDVICRYSFCLHPLKQLNWGVNQTTLPVTSNHGIPWCNILDGNPIKHIPNVFHSPAFWVHANKSSNNKHIHVKPHSVNQAVKFFPSVKWAHQSTSRKQSSDSHLVGLNPSRLLGWRNYVVDVWGSLREVEACLGGRKDFVLVVATVGLGMFTLSSSVEAGRIGYGRGKR